MKSIKSTALSGLAVLCLLGAFAALMSPVAAQTSGGTPEVAPPTGPPPRLPNGRPDLSGIWNPPYVPDMTRSGRRQEGYAEAPFSPQDTPQTRQDLRNKGNYAE